MTMIFSDPPSHQRTVTPNTLAALDLPLCERIEFIRKPKWFDYTRATDTLNRLEDMIMHPVCERMPSLLIAGLPNNGKSSIISKFRNRYPPCDNPDGGAIKLPVFYMQAPLVREEEDFYDAILERLFAPIEPSGNPVKKREDVLRLLKVVDTKMLVVDDAHNLIADSASRPHGHFNLLQIISCSLHIPVVAIGTKAAFRAIRSDDQLSRQFRHVYLDKWEPNREFVALLKSIERSLALKEPSNIASPKIAWELFRMSEGIIGELAAVVSDAAVHALRHGRECIDIEVLRTINWVIPSRRSAKL